MAVTAKPEISKILLDLGIEPVDVYAVDNAEKTYMSALIEGINTLEFANKGDSPRSRILREELRGVREKRRGLKTITKTIDKNKLLNRIAPSNQKISPQKLLPAASEEGGAKDQTIITSNLAERLGNIQDALQSLGIGFRRQLRLDKRVAEVDARNAKEQAKLDKENKLEKKKTAKFSGLGFKKLTKPAVGFFDTLINFFKNILIGSVLLGMLNWLEDSGYIEKAQKFGDFFTKHLNKILIGLGILGGLVLAGPLIRLFKVLKWVTTPLRWVFRKAWKSIFARGASKIKKPPGKISNFFSKLNPFKKGVSKGAEQLVIPGLEQGVKKGATKGFWSFLRGGGGTRLGKTGASLTARTGSKGIGALPLIGIAWDLGASVYRFSQGDTVGGFLSLGSAIPVLGWGVAALDIAREFGAFEGTPLRMSEGSLLNKIQTPKVKTPPLTSPTNTGNIQLLNLGGGGATAPVAAVESSSGSVVPNFSSSDPNNMTTLTVRSIYGLVN